MLKEKDYISSINENSLELKEILRNSIEDIKLKPLINDLAPGEGKLVRGLFTLIGGSFGRIDRKRILEISAAVELLHLATLVHDDIVDESKLRRGRITIHSKYGVKAGLFLGDYLFSQAYILFSKNCSSESIIKVSETIKFICTGEIDQFFSTYSFNSSIKDYLKRVNGKCASLFSLSLWIGAYEGKVSMDIVERLKKIGYLTGMAFQLIDDILDITSSEEILGKPCGNDIREGIYTLPVLYELNKENDLLKKYLEEGEYSQAVDLLRSSKGLDKTRELAEKYTIRSLNLIKQLPETEGREDLRKIVEKMLFRVY
ncbi:polyprenyl synthetase family protein [Clostridium sp. A1-XYC3]|uniref:Polyprenyl synthetase family protein n=1 Tax=Clostridium tanneri TaxID=3037988 RepID=A0ABU4JWS2_9CLOT|nr:polyprenyl synthetase family protein [Clostridium sp. A1-XYC3]MDW8802610.1 polyprenyl synthetase family protein [Clostridium sp. A1-XYC3]